MDTWLNNLRVSPAVGLRFAEKAFYTPAQIIEHARQWAKKVNIPLDVEKTTQWGAVFKLGKGIRVFIDTEKAFIESLAEMSITRESDGSALLTETWVNAPYTKQVHDLSGVLEVFLRNQPAQTFDRIGVVADIRLPSGNAPIGFKKYIEHIGHPWGQSPQSIKTQTSNVIEKTDKFQDIVVHEINANANLEEVGMFKMDYQRTYERPFVLDLKHFDEIEKASVGYFDRFGSGEIFVNG